MVIKQQVLRFSLYIIIYLFKVCQLFQHFVISSDSILNWTIWKGDFLWFSGVWGYLRTGSEGLPFWSTVMLRSRAFRWAENKVCFYFKILSWNLHQSMSCTLKKILYLHPPKHALLNQLLIKQLNQPYYSVGSTKKFSQNNTTYLTWNILNSTIDLTI